MKFEAEEKVRLSEREGIAKQMKSDGQPLDLIQKYTGLSEEKINRL